MELRVYVTRKKRLSGDTKRRATGDELSDLQRLIKKLKDLVSDLLLNYNIPKKYFDRLA